MILGARKPIKKAIKTILTAKNKDLKGQDKYFDGLEKDKNKIGIRFIKLESTYKGPVIRFIKLESIYARIKDWKDSKQI